jgi:putative hydrolase of the HAD superfamily
MKNGSTRFEAGRITDWVFDLDNTLYSRHTDIFGQIDMRMTAYVARLTGLPRSEARRYQKQLYREHGTTLAGLMAAHDIDPDHYLADVHAIDYSVIPPDRALEEAITALPGRKHLFTNGDRAHAENTLAALGFGNIFDSVFDIVAAGFEPKPRQLAYDRFIATHAVPPRTSAMFEDMARNLEVPKQMGMTTVLIVSSQAGHEGAESWEFDGHDGSHGHVDHVTDALGRFLSEVREA